MRDYVAPSMTFSSLMKLSLNEHHMRKTHYTNYIMCVRVCMGFCLYLCIYIYTFERSRLPKLMIGRQFMIYFISSITMLDGICFIFAVILFRLPPIIILPFIATAAAAALCPFSPFSQLHPRAC